MQTLLRVKAVGSLLPVVVLFLMLPRGVFAQWSAQIKTGFVSSTVTGESGSVFSSVGGFSGGAGVSYAFRYGLSVQTDVLYTVKGTKAEGLIRLDILPNPVGVRATFNITYLEVPVLLVYHFGGDSIQPKIFAGPYAAIKLDAEVEFQSTEGGPVQRETDDTVSNNDYGLTVGAGADVPIAGQIFTFGVRGSFGFANVRSADPALHNRAIGFYGGITF